jgi:hypothetical protein
MATTHDERTHARKEFPRKSEMVCSVVDYRTTPAPRKISVPRFAVSANRKDTAETSLRVLRGRDEPSAPNIDTYEGSVARTGWK